MLTRFLCDSMCLVKKTKQNKNLVGRLLRTCLSSCILWKVKVFGSWRNGFLFFFYLTAASFGASCLDWHPKSLNDTSCWQCTFAHTHTESLSLLLPWTSLREASILPAPLSTPHFNLPPLYVPLSKTFPEAHSCTPLYYEKLMKKNTLSINIVYDSESVSIPALSLSTESKGNCSFNLTFGHFTI